MTTVTRRSAAALAALTLAGTLAVPTLAFGDDEELPYNIIAYNNTFNMGQCVRTPETEAALKAEMQFAYNFPISVNLRDLHAQSDYRQIVELAEGYTPERRLAEDGEGLAAHEGLYWAHENQYTAYNEFVWELIDGAIDSESAAMAASKFAGWEETALQLIKPMIVGRADDKTVVIWTEDNYLLRENEQYKALQAARQEACDQAAANQSSSDNPSEDPADNPADNPSDDPTDDATAGDDSQDTTDGDSTDNATAGDDATTGTTAGTGAGTAAGAGGSGAVNTYSAGTTSGSGLAKTGAALGTLAIAAGAAGAGGLALRRYTK